MASLSRVGTDVGQSARSEWVSNAGGRHSRSLPGNTSSLCGLRDRRSSPDFAWADVSPCYFKLGVCNSATLPITPFEGLSWARSACVDSHISDPLNAQSQQGFSVVEIHANHTLQGSLGEGDPFVGRTLRLPSCETLRFRGIAQSTGPQHPRFVQALNNGSKGIKSMTSWLLVCNSHRPLHPLYSLTLLS